MYTCYNWCVGIYTCYNWCVRECTLAALGVCVNVHLLQLVCVREYTLATIGVCVNVHLLQLVCARMYTCCTWCVRGEGGVALTLHPPHLAGHHPPVCTGDSNAGLLLHLAVHHQDLLRPAPQAAQHHQSLGEFTLPVCLQITYACSQIAFDY